MTFNLITKKLQKMKKLILILTFIPFFSIAQNTKTDKVLNQVNSVTEVAGNVIGIFKKKKNKPDNNSETKIDNIKSTNHNSDRIFSINTKPIDIIASVYKCTNKNFDEYTKRCVWKPTAAEISELRQSSKDDYNDWLNDPKLMLAAEARDSVLTFKQNGIDNIVITTTLSSYSLGDKTAAPGWSHIGGFLQFQTTDGKQMKLLSNKMVLPEMGSVGDTEILKIDEENIFYSVVSWEGGTASHDMQQQNIYSLNGDFLLSYITQFVSAGQQQESYEMKIDEANKLIKIVEPKIITDKKGKVIKETYKTITTYQYGNGTITEIKQPVATKKK